MMSLCGNNKIKYIILTIPILYGLLVGWLLAPIRIDVNISDNTFNIIHAASHIDGHTYINSKEALPKSIQQFPLMFLEKKAWFKFFFVILRVITIKGILLEVIIIL